MVASRWRCWRIWSASSLNPLHCGAVVASRRAACGSTASKNVSIPFIAGQWSLLECRPREGGDRAASQSPSLRGSGRFLKRLRHILEADPESQSPSLRGSGRFTAVALAVATAGRRLNPLHCGAVVASQTSRIRVTSSPGCLNPLHCGAVVASRRLLRRARRFLGVSIPFIAGQWSLPCRRRAGFRRQERLNPLHCGAVVASPCAARRRTPIRRRSQSPSLRGSGRF